MEKVKLSTLSKDTKVYVEGDVYIKTVEEILEDIEYLDIKELYTVKEYRASFNARDIVDMIIENVYCNGGIYEDWDDIILANVSQEDVKDIETIFNRILARSPEQNIAYQQDKLIEIDI